MIGEEEDEQKEESFAKSISGINDINENLLKQI